jgi:hypothetical protein
MAPKRTTSKRNLDCVRKDPFSHRVKPAELAGLAALEQNDGRCIRGKSFVTGHDFSRAAKCPIRVLGFSPRRDTPILVSP